MKKYKKFSVIHELDSRQDKNLTPIFKSLPPKSISRIYFDTDEEGVQNKAVDQLNKFFKGDHRLSTFEEDMEKKTSYLPVFMGYPVFGNYEIYLDDPSENCFYDDNTEYTLYFVYSTKGVL